MNTISSSKPLKEDFERRYRKNLEMLNPNAAGLDLHKEEIWVCPGGFQDNYEPEVKTFGTLTGELRKLVAYLKEKKVTAVAMEATGIYWIPVFEMLKNEGFDTCLVNARNINLNIA